MLIASVPGHYLSFTFHIQRCQGGSTILHGFKFIFYVVKDRSFILHGYKERCSRQNYFRQVVVIRRFN